MSLIIISSGNSLVSSNSYLIDCLVCKIKRSICCRFIYKTVIKTYVYYFQDSKNAPLIIRESGRPKYDNVNIYKSKKVHVGDVTYINGPVIISNNNSAYNDKKISTPYIDPDWDAVFIVNRINWLAQPALGEKEHLDSPAKYVIICR